VGESDTSSAVAAIAAGAAVVAAAAGIASARVRGAPRAASPVAVELAEPLAPAVFLANPTLPKEEVAAEPAAGESDAEEEGPAKGSFLAELKSQAMKLHTRRQAPTKGERREETKEELRQQAVWQPTRESYLQYLVDSKAVFEAIEKVVAESSADSPLAAFKANGLERAPALAADLAWFETQYGIATPAPTSAGTDYAAFLIDKAETDLPGFMCHYYNQYFALTAGGLMIGKRMSKMFIDGHKLQLYTWKGGLGRPKAGFKRSFEELAATWSEAERNACFDATPASFQYAGGLLGVLRKGVEVPVPETQ